MKPIALLCLFTSLTACATTPDTLPPVSPAAAYQMETSSSNTVSSLTSAARATTGTKAEIISRAQACVAKTLTFGSVTATGSSAALAGRSDQSVSIGAGQLIEAVDAANGLLIANSRVKYSSAMIAFAAQAKVTIEAKDQKFRIVLANPEAMQLETGSASTDSFHPIYRAWGTGWSTPIEQLVGTADKLASCIEKPAADW